MLIKATPLGTPISPGDEPVTEVDQMYFELGKLQARANDAVEKLQALREEHAGLRRVPGFNLLDAYRVNAEDHMAHLAMLVASFDLMAQRARLASVEGREPEIVAELVRIAACVGASIDDLRGQELQA